jgi:thiol-disulfide isomerase/thioredoxin
MVPCTASVMNRRTRIPGQAAVGALGLALITVLLSLPTAASPSSFTAPELKLPGLRDEALVSVEEFRGKVVYLDFWASWCGPCRKSMPLYDEMYREIGTDRFEILAVNLDEDPRDALDFITQHPVSYPVLSDPSGAVAEAWGLKVMPTSFLLDPSGRVVKTYPGFEDSHMGEIRRDIDALLQP